MSSSVQEIAVAHPTGPASEWVADYHGYRQRGVPAARHLGLPSPFLTVIVTLDEPLRLAQHVDPRRSAGDYETVVGGLHLQPAVIEHDGAQSGIQLRVSPLGARALLGMPAGELAGIDVDGEEVLGGLARRLRDRVRSGRTWPERFESLDAELGRSFQRSRRPPAEVIGAWTMLRRSRGRAGVAAIADHVGWSSRHLSRRFEVEIGLTPKAAARVIRFDRARRLLPHLSGADVAARCGYADQSHLVRDFTGLAGMNPSRWLAAEVRNLQVAAPPTDADFGP